MAYETNSIFWVELDKIIPNPYQPRREFDEQKLNELAESIRMYGVLQPLVVTRKEVEHENGAFRTEYELIAGERRLRASKIAGVTQIPVIIRSGEETELMKLELAIIENLQREDLNPVDRALAFKQLADKFGLSHGQVAKKVGRSREYVSNSIRLLQLPEQILDALRKSEISDGHARTLLMLTDKPEEQEVIFREILLKKLSVREVERIARKVAQDRVRKRDWKDTDPELIEIERRFTESLGTRVQILKTDYGGRVTIDYFSKEDLDKLYELVNSKEEEEEQEQQKTQSGLSAVAEATPLEAVDAHNASPPEPAESVEADNGASAGYADPVSERPVTEPESSAQPASEPEAVPERPNEHIQHAHAVDTHDQPVAPETKEDDERATDQSTAPTPKKKAPEKEEDETDLYSIRNFGI